MAVVVVTRADNFAEQLYSQNCLVCHAEDGKGAMPGIPDLQESRAWSTLTEQELLARLKQGIQTPGSVMMMPPKGGNPDLTDDNLREIIRYMREAFLK